jgi:hypothetical protein
LETSQIKNKTKITNKAAPEEISSTVISDKPNLNIRKRRKKSKTRKLMKIKWKKRKNTKNLWGKFKPPLQKNQRQRSTLKPKNYRAKKNQFQRSQIVTSIKYAHSSNFWEKRRKQSTSTGCLYRN